jgi:hypothetical protein
LDSVKKAIPSICFTRKERGRYLSIARPDIQKLLVNNSLARLVPLASVNCVGSISRISFLISSSSVYFATGTEDLTDTPYAAMGHPQTAFLKRPKVIAVGD